MPETERNKAMKHMGNDERNRIEFIVCNGCEREHESGFTRKVELRD